ncbi:MAG TPA: class I adenylate-forming enzyme family protein, partial [Terriglobales bacterium]|nr:class I adenylate-forming enzyme family protein [Terriglobales bacterium]
MSLAGYLEDFLRRGPECAYVQRRGYRAERWSYRQVADMAFRFARELEERGIGKGERVLLWGPNSAEWVCVFFGCALRGVIVVPIDEAAATDFALRVHRQVDARLMVCSRTHVQSSLPFLLLDELAEALGRHSFDPIAGAVVDSSDTLE